MNNKPQTFNVAGPAIQTMSYTSGVPQGVANSEHALAYTAWRLVARRYAARVRQEPSSGELTTHRLMKPGRQLLGAVSRWVRENPRGTFPTEEMEMAALTAALARPTARLRVSASRLIPATGR